MVKTFGSICSGIGFQEMAIKEVFPEVELKFFSEIDKYAIKSFESIHGPIKNLGDFTKVESPEYVDFLFASTPCQDFSNAGLQKGFEGMKGSLTFELIEFLKRFEKIPKFVAFENVTGLLQEQFQEGYQSFKEELRKLGHKVNEFVLNAKDYGVPQNRDRVFLVCSTENRVILHPKKIKSTIFLKDLLEEYVDEKYIINSKKAELLIETLKNKEISNSIRVGGRDTLTKKHNWNAVCVGNINPSGHGLNGNVYTDGLSPTLTTNKGEGSKIIIPCLTPERVEKRQNGRRFKETDDPMFTLTSQDRHGVLQIGNIIETGNFNNPQRGRIYSTEGQSPALMTVQGGGQEPKIFIKEATKKGYSVAIDGDSINLEQPKSKTRRGRVGKGMAQTLNTQCNQGVVHNYIIRKLTPLECWRLMGAADEDFRKAEEVNSNSQLYKQAGNGIVVNVLVELFKEIKKSYVIDQNFEVKGQEIQFKLF